MEPITAALFVISFFVLRFAFPLLCTLGFCHLMNRWVAGKEQQLA